MNREVHVWFWEGLGVQLPRATRLDYEVPLSGVARRCGRAGAGDNAQPGDDNLRWGNQPGSRAHAHRHTAATVGIEDGAVSEGEELASDARGVSGIAQALLGPASVGSGQLGGHERQRHG